MLDLKMIRTEPDKVKAAIQKREMNLDSVIDEILKIDVDRRAVTGKVEAKKAEQNAASKQIPAMKKAGQDTTELMAQMKVLSAEIKEYDAELGELEEKQKDLMLSLPNLPDEDVVAGGKEQNVPLHYFKEKPVFDFPMKNHVDLCEAHGMIDYQRGAKIGGNGAWIYRGWGARMEWALLNFFVNEHLGDGYELILPPHMLNYECGYVAGQFPKFVEEVLLDRQPDQRRPQIHAAHRGDRAGEPPPRRGPHAGRAAAQIHRLYAVLPPRGGLLPRGRARHDPRPPVQ